MPKHDGVKMTESNVFKRRVIKRKQRNLESEPYGGESTFLGLPPHHWFRKAMIATAKHWSFEATVIVLIILNCVAMVLDHPVTRPVSWIPAMEMIDNVFVGLFTTEMIVKIVAMGFWVDPHAYLKDNWNRLDFFVVIASYARFIPGLSGNLSFIRTIRILRTLRAVSFSRGLRVLVNAVLSLPGLMKEVLLLLLFVFVLFGIMGMQLFGGNFRNRCFDDGTGLINEDIEALCRMGASPNEIYGCPVNNTCLDSGINPNKGISGFDNLPQAMLTIFIASSLEGWVDMCYMTFESGNFSSAIYFIFLVMIISFFVVQLITGLVCTAYQSTGAADEKDREQEEFEETRAQLAKEQEEDGGDLEGDNVVQRAKAISKAKRAPTKALITQINEMSSQQLMKIQQGTAANLTVEEGGVGFRWRCRVLVENGWFQGIIMVLIMLNTAMLATDHYGQPDYWIDALEYSNYVFTAIFTAELILKLYALGIKEFAQDAFNDFDAIVVLFSLLEIILTQTGVLGADSPSFSALRSLRAIRAMKIAKSWQYLQNLIRVMSSSFVRVGAFSVLLCIFMFIMTLVGVELFAGKLIDEETGESPRMNFDSFGWGWMVVFVVIGGENWNDVLYTTSKEGSPYVGILYCVILFILGNWVMLNLFLAILLANFDGDDDDDDEESSSIEDKGEDENGKEEAVEKKLEDGSSSSSSSSSSSEDAEETEEDKAKVAELQKALSSNIVDPNKLEENEQLTGTILCGIGVDNPLRKFCHKIVTDKRFEYFILTVIMISTFMLVFYDRYLDSRPTFKAVLQGLDYASTSIFILEVVLKVLAFGFYVPSKTGYFQDKWNTFDFVIVAFAVVDMFFSSLSFVKAMRALRSLRALRMVRRYESLLAVVVALGRVIPAILNLLAVQFFFYLVFGIIGTSLFKGLFYQCEGEDLETLLEPFGVDSLIELNQTSCPMAGGIWKNPDVGNFDNIWYSLLTLFEMGTMEMWPDVLLRAVDIGGMGEAPVRDATQGYSIFFFIFIIAGNFIITNLFVGSVVDTFTRTMAETQGRTLLSKEQNEWLDLQRMLLSVGGRSTLPLHIDNNAFIFRRWVFTIAKSKAFEYFILGCIFGNLGALAMYYYDMSDNYSLALDIANKVFTGIFIVEAAMKIYGFGSQYLADKWNVFDFIVVLVSIAEIIIEAQGGQLLSVAMFRALRAVRVVRLIKRAKTLRQLINTLKMAVPAMLNVGSFLLLVHVIYAIAGMMLFSGLRADDFLNKDANFDTFASSLFTLFRVTTGESYNGIMHDLMYNAGGPVEVPAISLIYFLSFVILSQLMALSLFIAAILEEFEAVQESASEEERNPLEAEDVEEFAAIWHKYLPPTPWYKAYISTLGRDDQVMSWKTFELVLKDMQEGLALSDVKGETGDPAELLALAIPLYKEEVMDRKRPKQHEKYASKTNLSKAAELEFERVETLCVHYYDVLMALCKRAFYKNKRKSKALRGNLDDYKNFNPFQDIDPSVSGANRVQSKLQSAFSSKSLSMEAAGTTETLPPKQARGRGLELPTLQEERASRLQEEEEEEKERQERMKRRKAKEEEKRRKKEEEKLRQEAKKAEEEAVEMQETKKKEPKDTEEDPDRRSASGPYEEY